MQNKATFEKAKALEAAGFPQPAPQVGQIWHTRRFGSAYLICRVLNDQVQFTNIQTGSISLAPCLEIVDACVYAPDATDILKELGRLWNLYYDKMPNREMPLARWAVTYDGVNAYGEVHYHENPADACADAYLLKNTRHASPA